MEPVLVACALPNAITMPFNSLVIFTDLDGTLIQHADYSYNAAKPLLKKLQSLAIPLILASSKTRAEIEVYRKRMDIKDPFIVENGGAVFVPRGYFRSMGHRAIIKDDYECLELGKPYTELVAIFNTLKKRLKLNMIGFHQMDVAKIMEMTGLSVEEAARASQREYDEPFVIVGTDSLVHLATLKEMAKQQRCKILKGGRFYHLIGSSNKGRAVRILTQLYRESYGITKSLGLGDSENDLTLLANVDVPILVQKADGSYDPKILEKLPQVMKAPAPGPEGWALSLTEQLHRL